MTSSSHVLEPKYSLGYPKFGCLLLWTHRFIPKSNCGTMWLQPGWKMNVDCNIWLQMKHRSKTAFFKRCIFLKAIKDLTFNFWIRPLTGHSHWKYLILCPVCDPTDNQLFAHSGTTPFVWNLDNRLHTSH